MTDQCFYIQHHSFYLQKIVAHVSFLKRSICTTETNFIKSSVFAKIFPLIKNSFLTTWNERKTPHREIYCEEKSNSDIKAAEGGLKQDGNSKASWFTDEDSLNFISDQKLGQHFVKRLAYERIILMTRVWAKSDEGNTLIPKQ